MKEHSLFVLERVLNIVRAEHDSFPAEFGAEGFIDRVLAGQDQMIRIRLRKHTAAFV